MLCNRRYILFTLVMLQYGLKLSKLWSVLCNVCRELFESICADPQPWYSETNCRRIQYLLEICSGRSKFLRDHERYRLCTAATGDVPLFRQISRLNYHITETRLRIKDNKCRPESKQESRRVWLRQRRHDTQLRRTNSLSKRHSDPLCLLFVTWRRNVIFCRTRERVYVCLWVFMLYICNNFYYLLIFLSSNINCFHYVGLYYGLQVAIF